MAIFFSHTPAWVLAAYWLAVATTVIYTLWKLNRRRYLFSPYSVVVYTFAFALLIVAPNQYDDRAWQVLGNFNAGPFYPFLDLSIGINATGFTLALLAMWWIESRPRTRVTPPLVARPPLIAISTVAVALVLGIVLFASCLAIVGTIPILPGQRTVFNEQTSLRPFYNFANYLILFTTSVVVVWSFIARSLRYVLLIILGLLCMLATGGRMSFLSVIQLILFMLIYRIFRGRTLTGTLVLVGGLTVIALGGLFLASFRTGADFSLSGVTGTILYGNTFSDVRDGAFVASAWDARMGDDSLGGNTYLAGLMSFIPSSISGFRETWSWGYFTTSSLFGWEDHFGFRGGWSLEMFMNFGMPGVIPSALTCGWLLGRLEAMFYAGAVQDQGAWFPNAYLWSWIGYGIFTVLIASSATYNLYSLFGIIVLLWFLSMIRRGLHRSLGVTRRPGWDPSRPMSGYAYSDAP